MQPMTVLTAALLTAVLTTAPATAVTVVDIRVAGDNEVTFVNAAPGLLESDVALRAFRPTVWTLQADAPGEAFAFNGLVDVFTGVTLGQGLKTLVLEWGGVRLLSVGSVTPAFSTVIQSTLVPGRLTLRFSDAGEFLSVGLGSVTGGEDFRFAFGANETEARLTLRAFAVPEPAAWALMIAGFGLVGAALRRRGPALRGARG